MKSEIKTKNGLPLEVKYCKKCNLSNQRTLGKNEYFHTEKTIHKTVIFDENGICAGCKFVEKEFDDNNSTNNNSGNNSGREVVICGRNSCLSNPRSRYLRGRRHSDQQLQHLSLCHHRRNM